MDGQAAMAQMALAGVDAGLTAICFTDHCDTVDGDGNPCRDFSWDAVETALDEARAAVGRRAMLFKGVELGCATQHPAYAAEILARPGIDFVIGSVHNPLFGPDYYYGHFTDPDRCRQLLREYCQQLLAIAKTDTYDVLGHLTYPLRYMRYRDGVAVNMDHCRDLLDAAMKAAIDKGKGIELNTSGYLNCGGQPMPHRALLERYRTLGGEIITIGSDAHVPERMAQGLADGMAFLKDVGFSYVTMFRERKPEFVKL
jgi:histidinol-phosphatase (PHP family)